MPRAAPVMTAALPSGLFTLLSKLGNRQGHTPRGVSKSLFPRHSVSSTAMLIARSFPIDRTGQSASSIYYDALVNTLAS